MGKSGAGRERDEKMRSLFDVDFLTLAKNGRTL